MRLINIQKNYGKKSILKKNSYVFSPGLVYFIEGPSGAGKTTLLNLIAGVEKLDSGKIFLNHLSIGYLPQNFQLMNELSVIENVGLPCLIAGQNKRIVLIKAQKLLKSLGLSSKLNDSVRILSGGEKQRVAFARALITDPDVLLLDEPFNQLDSKNLKKVLALFKNWFNESKICIWVRHDKKNAPLFSRALSKIIKL